MNLGRKLLGIVPVILGGAVLVFIVANKRGPEQTPPEERVHNVRIIEAEALDLLPRIIGYGTAKPEKVWNAVPQVAGTVIRVHPNFRKGAILEAGTEVVRIAPVDYELAIARAEANIRSAEAQLRELIVSEENTRQSLAIEERALAVKEKELARKQKLLGRGAASQSSVDQEQRDTLAQRNKVRDLENKLNLLPTQTAVQREQKAVFEAELEAAKLDLERTVIRLPFHGRIAEANVEETQYAQVGQVLGVVDSVKTAEVEAQVPISRFRMLLEAAGSSGAGDGLTPRSFVELAERFGIRALVRLRLGGRTVEWEGRFSRISDTIDPKTRTVGVIVAVDGSYAMAVPGERPPLAKGMFVEVEIRTKAVKGVIVVPRSALTDNRLLIVGDDDRLEIRKVETDIVQGGLAVIASGITPGTKVIVSDLSPAVDGMRINARLDEDLAADLRRQASGQGLVK